MMEAAALQAYTVGTAYEIIGEEKNEVQCSPETAAFSATEVKKLLINGLKIETT
ncbi:MAG TPA: hypothetical protein VK654_03875 [Nitrospirota bacterium]|nr:hypothetical protein [Nitrospirota bacterium]